MSFIFQALPERYDLREKIVEGNSAWWIASKGRDRMKAGVVVYFWMAGKPEIRGIYGWGNISGEIKQDEKGLYRVKVTYGKNFLEHESVQRHITIHEIESDPVLCNLLILRAAMGTNFLLNDNEDAAIRDLIVNIYGKDWLPPQVSSKGGVDGNQ